MGLRAEKEVSITIYGTFAAEELIAQINDLCDGDPSGYTGVIGGMYQGDQREPSSVTISLTKKKGPQ